MPGVPGCFAHTFSLSLPNFDFIIARDDRAEFTSGANEVSERSERRETRDDRAEFTSGANAVSATNVNDARRAMTERSSRVERTK